MAVHPAWIKPKKGVTPLCLACLFLLGGGGPWCQAREWSTNEYRAADVEKVWADAISQRRAMVFIYYEEDLDCSLCEQARRDVRDSLQDVSLFIYIEAKKDKRWIPVLVWEALRSPEAGHTYPITVVMDTLMTEALDVIPYVEDRVDRAEALRRARQAILRNLGRDEEESKDNATSEPLQQILSP